MMLLLMKLSFVVKMILLHAISMYADGFSLPSTALCASSMTTIVDSCCFLSKDDDLDGCKLFRHPRRRSRALATTLKGERCHSHGNFNAVEEDPLEDNLYYCRAITTAAAAAAETTNRQMMKPRQSRTRFQQKEPTTNPAHPKSSATSLVTTKTTCTALKKPCVRPIPFKSSAQPQSQSLQQQQHPRRASPAVDRNHDLDWRLKDPRESPKKLVFHATAYGSNYHADHFKNADKKILRPEWSASRTKARDISQKKNHIGGLGREPQNGEVLTIAPTMDGVVLPRKPKRLVMAKPSSSSSSSSSSDESTTTLDVAKALISNSPLRRTSATATLTTTAAAATTIFETTPSPRNSRETIFEDDLEQQYVLFQKEQLREHERKNYEFSVDDDILNEILAAKEVAAAAKVKAATRATTANPTTAVSPPGTPSSQLARKAFDLLVDNE